MSGIELKPMKIHTQKGKRRLWLEQQRYGLEGFTPGSSFKVTYHTDSIEIESDPEGSNKVFTRVKKPSKLHPTERKFAIVSLHNSKLKAIFGDTEDGVDTPCRYEQMPGYLKIWPTDVVEALYREVDSDEVLESPADNKLSSDYESYRDPYVQEAA